MTKIKVTRLPVYAEIPQDEDLLHEPEPDWKAKNTVFDHWCLAFGSVVVIGAIAYLGYLSGVFESPNQKLAEQNAKLTQQLSSSQAEVQRIQECVR